MLWPHMSLVNRIAGSLYIALLYSVYSCTFEYSVEFIVFSASVYIKVCAVFTVVPKSVHCWDVK